MTSTLLVAEDNDSYRKLLCKGLESDGYRIIDVADGPAALEVVQREAVDVLLTDVMMPSMDGIELLERAREIQPGIRAIVMTGHGTPDAVIGALRNKACDFLSKPFSVDEVRGAVRSALERVNTCELEVISAKADWIEIALPCDLSAVEPIQKIMTGLECNLSKETRESIGSVFRELLNNAIEHGGKCDLSKRVIVKYVRLKRAILYSIKDPGEGFDIGNVEHAAVANPEDDPLRHMQVRQERGLRPGGFGLLLASQTIDELIYNEKHNELIFVKYVDEGSKPPSNG